MSHSQEEIDAAWSAYESAEGLEYYHNAITDETTWDKPDALRGADETDSGDWFWVPDETQGYIVGQVEHEYYDGNTTIRTPTGEVNIFFYNPIKLDFRLILSSHHSNLKCQFQNEKS